MISEIPLPSNAELDRFSAVSPSAMVTSVKVITFLNAPSPTVERVSGKLTEAMLLPTKASLPIDSRQLLSLSVKTESALFTNAPSPISVTESGISISVVAFFENA